MTKEIKRKTEKLDFDKVWLMFQETKELLSQSSLETDRKFKETDAQFQKLLRKLSEIETI